VTETPIDLEQARKRAKELLRRARAGDEDALARLRSDREPRLADAQLAVARELGFTSWPALKHEVEAARATFEERVERFVEDATVVRFDRARRWLQREPAIASAGVYPALLLGDQERVAAELRQVPGFAQEAGGPRGWQPLLYVCHSCFLGRDPERTDGLVETARLLLDAGADPNATAPSPNWPGSVWTPLYGAAGVGHEPRLTHLLLEAGANPDDNESLYHSCETRDHACLQLLLEAGATVNGTNALPHMLDYDDLEGARILLDAGADPNVLRHAVLRGRGPEFVELLVQHGADLERRNDAGLTAYALAVRRNRPDLAETLAALGARPESSTVDEFLAACRRADAEGVRGFLERDPGLVDSLGPAELELLPESATWYDESTLRLLLEAGFPVDARGELEGTALHHAAWWGTSRSVALLLEHGAAVNAGSWFGADSTPLAWAAHGSVECLQREGDWLAVAEQLVAAGARVDPGMVEGADEELAAWLEERVSPGDARTEAR
jgi:ankyrin repeat protein